MECVFPRNLDLILALPLILRHRASPSKTEQIRGTKTNYDCPLDASLKISAIFVYKDPNDWALDTQIILDLRRSRDGVLGTDSGSEQCLNTRKKPDISLNFSSGG